MKVITNVSLKITLVQLFLVMAVGIPDFAAAQGTVLSFGKEVNLMDITSNTKKKETAIKWIDVNTSPDTWKIKKEELVCSGNPIGVMRSEKQYENFLLHIEWKHMEAGGNSGVFVWSDAKPDKDSRLPNGVEVQMLELDWVNLNQHEGKKPPIAYVHGELFGVNGVKTIPDNPRGERSKSIVNLCKGKGEWNTYVVTCIDGVIKLSVNGVVVNGISQSSQKKGYICLESEGAPIHFRNLKIIELPSGITSAEQTAAEIKLARH
ncbi:3-keto-disaccharide hydrolase [Pedobacter immunditicola]|uniref:3-keto-disaccharide hydrolase n=1 Tax=Pedobacter immunditicola TaxID=3133440 RepID=UPI0030A3759D